MAMTKPTSDQINFQNSVALPQSLTVDGTTLVVNGSTNRVGIGVAAPTTALDVSGTVTATALAVTTVTATSVAGSLTSNNSVSTANITAGAVTAPKLAARVTFPDYANGVSITLSSGTVYQAATDIYICATLFKSLTMSVELYVGATNPPTPLIWKWGQNVNSYNWDVGTGMIPVPQGYYYQLNFTAGTTGLFTRYPVFTA